ncbi:MAG: alkaline phosphatase [Verrucomicrobiota bacterium]|jgi:alkaline phosphatase|nr:alkaline phosphatase [Verrucomicrobiota bacterium]
MKKSLLSVASCVTLSACAWGARAAAAPLTPLPLAGAANSTFADQQADDRQGGWTDQGGNDLRLLKPGYATLAGVPFEIQGDAAGKSCIVLGGPTRPYLPGEAALTLPEGAAGTNLYLLHAIAFPPKANDIAAQFVVEYADGKTDTQHLRFGRDAADWLKPAGFKNAARAWTVYNNNTQVSLFVSRFPLKAAPVRQIRLQAKAATWMVAAATLGDAEVPLRPLPRSFALTKTYASPPPFDPPLTTETNAAAPRNVIFILGDGMGQGVLKLTSLRQHRAEGRLVMQSLPFAALCTTFPAGGEEVTDSAASGTAFSCGHKTINGMIGQAPDGRPLVSIATAAQRAGRSVGLLTTDAINGATPAVYYAHVKHRSMAPEIIAFLPDCGFDILVGNTAPAKVFADTPKGGGASVLERLTAKGYAPVSDIPSFRQAPAGRPVLGFMDLNTVFTNETCVADMLTTAASRLEGNPKGFFMLVEGHLPDKGGHGNLPDTSLLGTVQVDWAVRAAVEYARAKGDTLVVVTADHETGGVSANLRPGAPDPDLLYTTTSHTGTPVLLYAYGPGAQRFSGVIDNTDIPRTFADLLSLDLDQSAPAK